MTSEQKEMLANEPVRKDLSSPVVTKKRMAIALGIAVGIAAVCVVRPRILKKVQLSKDLL